MRVDLRSFGFDFLGFSSSNIKVRGDVKITITPQGVLRRYLGMYLSNYLKQLHMNKPVKNLAIFYK